MLLTLTSLSPPARDLGHILRKHPDRLQSFPLGFGTAYVFYSEANDERCTAALLLDIDPVALVRGNNDGRGGGLFDSYVTDRPYVASSFLSVALARVLGSALSGKAAVPEVAERPLQLEARIAAVRLRDRELAAQCFEPLGLRVTTHPVDVPAEARSGANATVIVAGTLRVRQLLSYLYVLIPVLDAEKHYWVGDEEADKLLRHGADWLPTHPHRDTIVRRYLARAPKLARATVLQLQALDEKTPAETMLVGGATTEESLEKPMRLQERRVAAVVDAIRASGLRSVADIGCGDGDLVVALAREPGITRIVACDVSARELERLTDRLSRTALTTAARERIAVVQSSVLYADRRLEGIDAMALLEVIEHIDEDRLATLERVVFGTTRPKAVIVTTPNAEYNVNFPRLAGGGFRHPDHRFEWTRAQFAAWTSAVAQRHGYAVSLAPIGDDGPAGAPTQMATFRCA